jgi:hypothetical protein
MAVIRARPLGRGTPDLGVGPASDSAVAIGREIPR